MKKLCCVILMMFLMTVLTVSAAAQTYSREYPDLYNSGSPLWLHCNLEGYGDYVVLVDPDTNLQSFGFDAPTGYNLINNTDSTINGRAYSTTSNEGYICRWLTYYCLQFRIPNSGLNTYTWTDVRINAIYGTTLDLIDYVGDRGNDYFDGLSPDYRILAVLGVGVGVIVLLISRTVRRFSRGRV